MHFNRSRQPLRLTHLLIAVLTSVVLVGGCQSLKNPRKDWTAQRYYEEGKSALVDGKYQDAIELFQELESRYPYGRYSEQGQLEIAYAYYRDDEPELAIQAADRFDIERDLRFPISSHRPLQNALDNPVRCGGG